jgi:hypothetical protein
MRLSRACLGLTAAVLLAEFPARADLPPETLQACHQGYEQGQRLRRAGHLIQARKELLTCARDPCPSVFQPECVAWLAEVDRVLPSVVLDVRTGGMTVSEARVWLDGQALADKLDGRAISVDPGEHHLRVEIAGLAPVEKRELLVEGEKAHLVAFDLAPARAAPIPTVTRPTPWAAIVTTSVGVLAVGSFAYFGATGLARRDDVLNQCLEHCQSSDISYVREHFTIADVSLAVSVVALGAATYLWIRWAGSVPRAPSAAVLPAVWTF